jgi:uncharacterized protein (TIGR03067 family)
MYPSLLVGLAVSLAAPAPKEPPKKEPSIVGEWVGEKLVMGGKEVPPAKGVKGMRFTFAEDGKFTAHGDADKPDTGTYKIDAKKDPPELDLIVPTGKATEATLGIYKIEGDTLTICITFTFGQKGAKRPAKLESPDDSDVMLMTFKRAKK